MARSFQLTPGPKPATNYIIEASADNLGPWTTTDTIDAAALVDLLDGTYRLDAPLSPTDQYVRIIPTDGTLYGAPNRIYSPQPTEPGVFNLYVDTVTLGMGIADGLIFAAAPVGSYVVAGQTLGAALAAVKTGASPWAPGHAELTPPADVGNIRITLTRLDGPVTERVIEVIVDTTDLGGQSINFATLLPAPV
jgi:hypothetical protein